MNLGTKDPNGNTWQPASPQEAALHMLGADSISYGENGNVFVVPEIDLSDYADKLNTSIINWLTPKIKAECNRRITEKISVVSQQNITAYSIKLLKDVQVLQIPLSDAEKADLTIADAIWQWINGTNGMLATCRKLIQDKDFDYEADNNWPAWDDNWSSLVARF